MYGTIDPELAAVPPQAGGERERDTLLPTDGAAASPRRPVWQKVFAGATIVAMILAIVLFWSGDWDRVVRIMGTEPDGEPRGKSNFTGSQVSTRRTFGYGLYVFEVLPNIDKRATVTTLGTFIPRPPPGDFLQVSRLWRMTELDVSFAPQGVAGQREFVHCSGHFPRADCNISRSGNADAVDASLRGFEMPGGYTDDTLVKAVVNNIKAEKKKNPLAYWNITLYDLGKLKTWGDLVNATGEGGLFRYAADWPLPHGLCYAWNTTTCVNRTSCLEDVQCEKSQRCTMECNGVTTSNHSVSPCLSNEPGKGCTTECHENYTAYHPEYAVPARNPWGLEEGLVLKDKNNKLCNSFCQKHSVTHNASNCTISCDTNRTISNFQSCVHYKFCWVNTTTKAKNTDSVCVQTLPPGQSQSNTMFTTVYRMPAGVDTITEKGVTASFLPHKPIDRWDVSGYIMGSSGAIHNPSFNPYTYFHTYTIKFSPKGIFYYVNAPGKGFDIANARPVMNMTVEDYPDIKMMGPDMPGGDMAWEPQHGPSLMGPQGLGQSQMTAKMYFDEVMGGPVRDFKCTETFIKRMAWRPLPPDPVPPLKPVNGTNGTLVYPSPLPSPSPKPESPNDKPFEVDFSKVSSTHWWMHFREHFMVDHDDAGIRSAANVDFGVGPDGSTALILKGCQHEQMVGKAVYMLAPGGWAQVLDMKTGDLMAEADNPRYDLFPLHRSGYMEVWVVVQGGRCGYGLGSGSWKLMPGRGDVINGTLCSFMQTENSDSHLFNLPDGTKKLLITPAPHAF